jgi:hypothetical protein
VRKFISLTTLIILAASLSMSAAQDDTTTQTTGNTSTIDIFYVACENQGVINFTGTMEPGFDIYYQLFSGANAGGQALTSLRRVPVDGSYAVSDQITYDDGQTVPAGSTGSARVIMAREGNPNSTIFETTVNDLQDGCNNPQHPLVSSVDAGQPVADAQPTQGVRSPFGGFLSIVNPRNPPVVIGVPEQPGRSNKPGEIFAECNQYREISDPGIVYDTDNIVIFWSWFARSEALVQEHIENAIYEVKFQTAPLVNVVVSPIEQLGTNYWVFYYAQIGNLSPGTYGVEFKLRWEQEIDDGYEKFGPGTTNDRINGSCTFEVQRNPFGDQANIRYNGMYSIDR